MTRPQQYLLRMLLFLVVVAGITTALVPVLGPAFMANIALNAIIAAVLAIGVLYIFRQVWMLNPEVAWIENFRQTGRPALSGGLPRLLSPMANVFGDRAGRLSLSPVSMRTMLDGIGARLDEQRETSRYLIGVLVFLGLLGTFYGLLVTVKSVGGVIGGLSANGQDIAHAMADLKSGLQTPLNGMGTAFSSSLFGLAGSLVLGFLDLQAGQAQNRFFNELEEWLSGLTRLSGDHDPSTPTGMDEATRSHIRNIDLQLGRLVESSLQGREQTAQEIRLLARSVAALVEKSDRVLR